MIKIGAARDAGPDAAVVGIRIGWGEDDRTFSGFAWNFARQAAQQKKYSLPLYDAW
jgi:hypothetical protein